MKYYPRDWRADPRLRMCSLAARGLWADLLGYMHEAEPYGYLLIDGKKPDMSNIASLVGRPMGEVKRAMTELDEHGVFSLSDNQIIFSRRMVRDAEKEARDRANGKGGGNPALTGSVKPGVNPPVKAQKPEAREQKVSANALTARARKTPLPDDFVPERATPLSLGWSEIQIDKEIEHFKDSSRAHNRKYADWQAAWKNWCRSPFQTQQRGPPVQATNGRDAMRQHWRETLEKLDKYGEGGGGDIREAPVRLLPAAGSGEPGSSADGSS